MLKRDYLERMIEQLGDALARASARAKAGEKAEAERDLDGLYDRTLGMPRRMLGQLDLGSVRALLGGEKLAALVLLLEAEAELRRLDGDESKAAALEKRATALRDG